MGRSSSGIAAQNKARRRTLGWRRAGGRGADAVCDRALVIKRSQGRQNTVKQRLERPLDRRCFVKVLQPASESSLTFTKADFCPSRKEIEAGSTPRRAGRQAWSRRPRPIGGTAANSTQVRARNRVPQSRSQSPDRVLRAMGEPAYIRGVETAAFDEAAPPPRRPRGPRAPGPQQNFNQELSS